MQVFVRHRNKCFALKGHWFTSHFKGRVNVPQRTCPCFWHVAKILKLIFFCNFANSGVERITSLAILWWKTFTYSKFNSPSQNVNYLQLSVWGFSSDRNNIEPRWMDIKTIHACVTFSSVLEMVSEAGEAVSPGRLRTLQQGKVCSSNVIIARLPPFHTIKCFVNNRTYFCKFIQFFLNCWLKRFAQAAQSGYLSACWQWNMNCRRFPGWRPP